MDAPALATGTPGQAMPAGPLGRSARALLDRFGVGAEHLGLLVLGAVLLALVQAGDMLVGNVADTLFVKRVGPGWLPPIYFLRSAILVAVLSYVGVALERGRRLETIRALILVSAVAPLLFRLILLADHPVAYGFVLVAAEVVSFPLIAALWTLFVDLVPGDETRRVGGALIAVGLVGEALGAALSAPLAHLAGVENSLLGATVLAAAAGLVLARITNRSLIRLDVARAPKLPPPPLSTAYQRAGQQTVEAIDLGRRSALFRFLVATTGVASALAPFVDLQFQIAAALTFAGELELLSFYALLKGLLAVAAIALQLVAFGWLRREAGVARTLLVLPLAGAAAVVVMLGSAGVATYALVWAMLRLGGAAVDEPARRFLYDLFPSELKERVDWLANRSGRNVAAAIGSLGLIPLYYLGGLSAVTTAVVGLMLLWLVVAALFRASYGRLVLATSLMNRVDFDQLRPDDVSHFLDRAAVRQLERELVSGVPARAQLAIELLQQIADSRLPFILAASYVRQPPALRTLFLTTIQECLRDAPRGSTGVQPAIAAIARLVRSRLPDAERAALIRIYGQAVADQGLDPKDAVDLLAHLEAHGVASVELALAAARYRLAGGDDAAAVLAAAIERAFASRDEHDVHLAVAEIEDLVRADPTRNADLLARYRAVLDAPALWSPRIRAHVIGAAARLAAATGEIFPRADLDGRIVPLALDRDPRIVAAALDYLRHPRFLAMLETHVLPNLTAGNHHVRERAREVVRYFGASAVPSLLELVRSGTRRERLAAARLLGSYPVGRATHRDLIAQEIHELERHVVNVGLLHASENAASYTLLTSRLEEEAIEHVRAVLRLIYADTGDEALIRIERQLTSQDGALRTAAVEALDDLTRGLPGAHNLRRLIDGPIAARAADARGRVANPPTTIDELLRRCTVDPNWVTRLIACHTIGVTRRHALRDVLVEMADDPRAALRTEAEEARQRLGANTPPEDGPMTIVERMLLLKETELFRNLEARDLAGIATVVKESAYAPGDRIIREGDRGDFLAIIASGKVTVLKRDDKGGEFTIRSMGAPEVVGEIALLEEGVRSASIVADSAARALLLSRAEFEALIEEYPGVALGMARVLSRRLATMTAQAVRR